jgi:hypothetical protein
LEQKFSQLRIEKIDILTHPGKALRQRVRIISTLRDGNRNLSGIFLSSARIRQFVAQALGTADEG